MADLKNFQRTDYMFGGIYRGVVEDNADPLDSGRLRVRIRTIHTVDGRDLPVDQLPWAEPAIGLFWSGGRNIVNRDHESTTPDNPSVNRYNPGPPAKTPENTNPQPVDYPINGSQPQNQVAYDEFGDACGTGGIYTVPKRGNWVFVFFEHGNHMNPIYFAMAPNKRDWDYQKTWRNGEIDQKIGQLKEFKSDFAGEEGSATEPRTVVTGKDWASNAKVDSRVKEPEIFNIQLTKDVPNSNRDITCITSLNGSTIVIDNRKDQEQIYIIHKNYLEFTDKDGNRTEYVGKQRGLTPKLQFAEGESSQEIPSFNDADVACNYELGVEGNHFIHVLGNYDMFVHGRVHIQCDEHVQIDAKKSVGVVTKEGDVDVIAEKGNVNLDVQNGYVNAHIQKNLNAHIVGNTNVKIDGNLKATVGGNSHQKVSGNALIKAVNVDVECSEKLTVSASERIDFDTPELRLNGTLNVGEDIVIGGTCDVKRTCSFGAELFVQTGINCGGYLYNKGIANLGAPVIANGLQVQSGSGPGRGKSIVISQSPGQASEAEEATQDTENGPDNKNFEDSDPQVESN